MPDLWRICTLLPSLLLLPLCCRNGVRADSLLLPESSNVLLQLDTTFVLFQLQTTSTGQFQTTSLPIPETTPTVIPATTSSELPRTSLSIPEGTHIALAATSSSEFQRTSTQIVNVPTSTLPVLPPVVHTSGLPQSSGLPTNTPTPLTPTPRLSPSSTVTPSTSTGQIVPSPIPSSTVEAISSDVQMSSSPQLLNNLAVMSSTSAALPVATVVVSSSIVATAPTETVRVSSSPSAMPVSPSSSVPSVLSESITLIRSTSVPESITLIRSTSVPEPITLIRSTSVPESITLIRSTSVPESITLIHGTSVPRALPESSTLIHSTSVPGVLPESSTLIRGTSIPRALPESSTLIRGTSVPGVLPESSTLIHGTSIPRALPESSTLILGTSVPGVLPESSTLIHGTSVPGVLPESSTLIRGTSILSQPEQSSVSLQTPLPSLELISQLPSSSLLLPITSNLQPRQAATSQPASTVPVTSVLPTATPLPSGGTATSPTTGTTASSATPTPSNFRLSTVFLIGIAVGGGVIAVLLLIILILCCCCACSTVKKRRKRRQRYQLPRTYINPQAVYANGRAPSKYRHQTDGSLEAFDLQYVNMDEPLTSENNYHEMAIESELEDQFGFQGEASQLQQHSQMQHSQMQHSQMSAMTDLFQEHTLPQLSPISYSSQLQLTGAAYSQNVFHHMEPERGPPALASESPYLGMTRFPNSSPSLRVPTRMALSLQNEESKSMQGSKVSLPGSKSSHQGSKASILGSRTSVQGSRSQIFHSGPPRDEVLRRASSMLEAQRENLEEDTLSLQWSGRTASPVLDENQVPTRDSPVAPPLATSQPLGYGKKDFASLTCIPNHPAMEEEELTLQEEAIMEELLHEQSLHEVGKPLRGPETPSESSVSSPRRQSTGRVGLGEMTTLPGQEEAPKPSNDREDAPTPAEPSPSTSGQNAEEETGQKKSSPAIKKSRSRTMSKLEKLTSLDYIRASLRLKKKRVSFQKSPESTPKSKKKKKKKPEQEIVFTNKALLEGEGEEDLLTPPQSPTSKFPQQPKIHPTSPPRYPPTGDFFSPEDEFDLQGGPYLPPTRRQRAYTDVPNLYPAQLSQPLYYSPMAPYQQDSPTTYAQLSQQYYPPTLDTYYPQPYPIQPNPYGRRYSHEMPAQTSRYPGMVRPEGYSRITSPDHERQRSVTTPERYLEPGSRLDAGFLRAHSPDRFTDTSSNMSDRHQPRSPDRFTESSYSSDRYADSFGFMPDRYLPDIHHDLNLRTPERYVDPHYPGATSPSRFSDVRTPDTLVGSIDGSYSGVGMPDRFLDSMERDRHYGKRPPDRVSKGFERRRDSNSKQIRKLSDASNSDKSAPRSKVSWDSEIIEYPRPPSDLSESDIDLNL